MILLDGLKLNQNIQEELKIELKELKKLSILPALAVILLGDDKASNIYVNKKIQTCENIGIKSIAYKLGAKTTQQELLALIEVLNHDDSCDGILIQLPLPPHINTELIIQSIKPSKDVDGFHPLNAGSLFSNKPSFFNPCTPQGIITLLKHYNIDLKGLDSLVIGASNIVGRPMAAMLLNEEASVSICHKNTRDLSSYAKRADLLVSATGVAHLIKKDMVKKGAIVVDVGMNRLEGKLVGDVDFENVAPLCSYISKVPGGVGPMTVAMLMQNTIKSAKNRLKNV